MVTGRIPKDFTGVWMRVSTHKNVSFSSLYLILDEKTSYSFRIILQFFDFSFLQARIEWKTKKCVCKENHRVLRVKWGVYFCFSSLDLLFYKPSEHCSSVSCQISDFFWFSVFFLNVKYKWGYKKIQSLSQRFCLQNKTCALFSELAMNSPVALLGNMNTEVHDHESEFSDIFL